MVLLRSVSHSPSAVKPQNLDISFNFMVNNYPLNSSSYHHYSIHTGFSKMLQSQDGRRAVRGLLCLQTANTKFSPVSRRNILGVYEQGDPPQVRTGFRRGSRNRRQISPATVSSRLYFHCYIILLGKFKLICCQDIIS